MQCPGLAAHLGRPVAAVLTALVLCADAINVHAPPALGGPAEAPAHGRWSLARALPRPRELEQLAAVQQAHDNASQHACSTVGSEFEDRMDRLSWELLDPPMISAVAQQWSAGPADLPKLFARLMAGADHQLGEEAVARILKWQGAVQRVQERQRHAAAFNHTGSDGARARDDTFSSVLPPICPSDVPDSDPYWHQIADITVMSGIHEYVYNECQYSEGCSRRFTNLERIDSIRRTLKATKGFLEKHKIQYVLYGGSAIGALRCEDVLPWDVDSDVLVQRDQFPVLFDQIPRGARSVDMADLGFPGFQLKKKSPGCQPLIVVDRSTGFFTDLFPMVQKDNKILSPWDGSAAKATCNAAELFPPCQHQGCFSMSASNTLPPSHAKVHSTSFPVAHRLSDWLIEQYGPSVVTLPDVKTHERGSVLIRATAKAAARKVTAQQAAGREDETVRSPRDGASPPGRLRRFGQSIMS